MPPKRARSPQSPTEVEKRMKTANQHRVRQARRLLPAPDATGERAPNGPPPPPPPPPPQVFPCASPGCIGRADATGDICSDCKAGRPAPNFDCATLGCSGRVNEWGSRSNVCKDCKERGPPPPPPQVYRCNAHGCKGGVDLDLDLYGICSDCKAGLAPPPALQTLPQPSTPEQPEQPAAADDAHMAWLREGVRSYPQRSPEEIAMASIQSIDPSLLLHLGAPLTGQDWEKRYGRTGSGIGNGIAASPYPPLYAGHPPGWRAQMQEERYQRERDRVQREQPPSSAQSSTQPSSAAIVAFLKRSDKKKGGSRNMNSKFKSKSKTRRLRRSRNRSRR